MKCLTLTQPWATLIAIGAKRVETRSWGTRHRGPIAIHAAKGLGPVGGVDGLLELASTEPFCSTLAAGGHPDPAKLPRGVVVATAQLHRVVQMTPLGVREMQDVFPEVEFGHYAPGRFAWVLRDIVPLASPIVYRGAQGLFDVPDYLFSRGSQAAA